MDQNLHDALKRLSDAPRIGPDPVATDRVLTRVHRGRAVRATATGALALALVGGAAAAITLPRDGGAPIQGPTPTTSPAPSVTHAPTPSPTPTPTPPAAPPTAVALTATGDLVEVDATTGAVVRTIGNDPDWYSVALSPDRQYAYLTDSGAQDHGSVPDVQRVALADGAVTTVATAASRPAVSPDGSSLAYVAKDDAGVTRLEVMDLATGSVTATIGPPQGSSPERMLVNPTWTPDSSSIIVGQGWADQMPRVSLWELVPDTTATLDDARHVDLDEANGLIRDWEGTMSFTSDGVLLAAVDEGTADQWDAMATWAFGNGPAENLPTSLVAAFDTATGTVRGRIPVPGTAVAVAADPTGPTALVLVGQRASADPAALYRWDGSTLTHLGDGFTAVDW